MKLGRWVILGKHDESLAQGSSGQNWQEVMDSKEMWSYNLLGLLTKRQGGENWESWRTRDSSQNSWEYGEVIGGDRHHKRRSDLEEDNELDLEHVDLGCKVRKPTHP